MKVRCYSSRLDANASSSLSTTQSIGASRSNQLRDLALKNGNHSRSALRSPTQTSTRARQSALWQNASYRCHRASNRLGTPAVLRIRESNLQGRVPTNPWSRTCSCSSLQLCRFRRQGHLGSTQRCAPCASEDLQSRSIVRKRTSSPDISSRIDSWLPSCARLISRSKCLVKSIEMKVETPQIGIKNGQIRTHSATVETS